jgi:hypothetical protein
LPPELRGRNEGRIIIYNTGGICCTKCHHTAEKGAKYTVSKVVATSSYELLLCPHVLREIGQKSNIFNGVRKKMGRK